MGTVEFGCDAPTGIVTPSLLISVILVLPSAIVSIYSQLVESGNGCCWGFVCVWCVEVKSADLVCDVQESRKAGGSVTTTIYEVKGARFVPLHIRVGPSPRSAIPSTLEQSRTSTG